MPSLSDITIRRIELGVVLLVVLFGVTVIVGRLKTDETDLAYEKSLEEYQDSIEDYEKETSKWNQLLVRFDVSINDLDASIKALQVKQDPLPQELEDLKTRMASIEAWNVKLEMGIKSVLQDDKCPTEVRNRFSEVYGEWK